MTLAMTRADVEQWVKYHEDWPTTMAYQIGAALLEAWDARIALTLLLEDIAMNKNHPVIESRGAEWLLEFIRVK